jgi:transcriptional regulator with XRE-family HTH domain
MASTADYRLGDALRKIRTGRGLLIEQVARELAIDPTDLERMEEGIINVPGELLIRLAGNYNTAMKDILPKQNICPRCDGTGYILGPNSNENI